LAAGDSVLDGWQMIAAEMKQVADLSMSEQEALRLPW